MGAKVEIGWTVHGEDGGKRHVLARKFGGKWTFFERPKRRGKDIQWQEIDAPPYSDWIELLEALERRHVRDQTPLADVKNVRRQIQELFPEPPPRDPGAAD
jgi:hypothetical protein